MVILAWSGLCDNLYISLCKRSLIYSCFIQSKFNLIYFPVKHNTMPASIHYVIGYSPTAFLITSIREGLLSLFSSTATTSIRHDSGRFSCVSR